jgi:hypothetical protein
MQNLIKFRLCCIATQQNLHCFVNTLPEAIILRMSSCTHIEFGIQFPHKRLPEFATKSWVPIRGNKFRNAMKFLTIVNKEISSFFCCYFFMTRDEMSHFRQVANQNQNSSEIVFGTFG